MKSLFESIRRARGRIAFSPIIPAIIGAIIILANITWLLPARDSLRETVSKSEAEVAKSGSMAIEDFLESRKMALHFTTTLLYPNLSDTRNRTILDQLIKQGTFTKIILANTTGQEVIRIDKLDIVLQSELGTVFDMSEFNTAISSGEIVFGDIRISETFEPIMSIATPISLTNGRIGGVLIAELNLKSIFSVISDVTVGGSGFAYLTDKTGLLISHPDQSLVLKNPNYMTRAVVANTLQEKRVVSAADDRYTYTDEDGMRMLAAGSFIQQTDWVLVVAEERTKALAQLRTIELLALMIVVFVLAALVVLQRLFARLESERRHISSIITNLTDGLIEYDGTFTITLLNRAAEQLLGVREKDVLRKEVTANNVNMPGLRSISQVMYPALVPSSHTVAKLSGGTVVSEIKITSPVERDLQIITAPITDIVTGEVNRFIKIVRDVTREKVITRSKSEFISIAAHQMRTPLSGVKWSMKLVLDGDAGTVEPKQKELLGRAYEANERMIRLVADLLDVARIDEGRFGYEFKKNDLVKTARDMIEPLKPEAERRKITLSFNAEPVEPFSFDASRIALVIQNLVENSIRYTLPGGFVHVSIKKGKGRAIVSVEDTGVGIPRKELPRIFTKFFRAENIIRMQTDGSGLGLFIVRNIVRQHGGEIYITSEQNKGTRIWFTIPYDESRLVKTESNMIS